MSYSPEELSKSHFDVAYAEKSSPQAYTYDDGAVAGESFEVGDSWYARAQRFAGKFGVEQRGIERVPNDERTDAGLYKIGTMWLAANMVISSFAIGTLASQVFYLGFIDGILTTLFFNLLGVLSVCFFSSFGPRFGLRQMVLSRFWYGWWGVKLIAVFNCLACIGWSAVNVIIGAQLIHAVNHNVPGWAGIIIIAACTFIITLFGYKIVHVYEFWSWIPTFIVFLIVLGEFCHSGAFVNLPMSVGLAETGNVLSYGAVVFGFATGWTSYAADYTVYQPADSSRVKVFAWTWLGLIPPLLFTEMLGVAVATAAGFGTGAKNIYAAGYLEDGSGGLLAAVLVPRLGHFGDFCLIILALSIIANNCPNIYSVSLTVQVFGRWTQGVPRFIWTFVGTLIYIAVAIPGYYHFLKVLQYFMDFIGYWLAIYQAIALVEHFVFRKGITGYQPEHYDQPNRLPVGLAAFVAFCAGIAGMVIGMSQVWWVGPIALKCGEAPFGGDVGFELAAAFSAIVYLALRPIEKNYFKR